MYLPYLHKKYVVNSEMDIESYFQKEILRQEILQSEKNVKKLNQHFKQLEILISISIPAIISHPLFSKVSFHTFSIFLQKQTSIFRFSILKIRKFLNFSKQWWQRPFTMALKAHNFGHLINQAMQPA